MPKKPSAETELRSRAKQKPSNWKSSPEATVSEPLKACPHCGDTREGFGFNVRKAKCQACGKRVRLDGTEAVATRREGEDEV
jgi:uncharacterized protein (DUF983 family)